MAAAAATAVRKNKERKARELADFEEDVVAVFQQFDADGSGDIDKTELGAALAKLGIQANEQQLSQILTKFDAGNTASLTLEEFRELVVQIRGTGDGRAKQRTPPPSPTQMLRAKSKKAVNGATKPIQKCCNPKCTLPYQDTVHKYYNNPLIVFLVAGCIVGNFLVNIIEKEIDPWGDLYPSLWYELDLAFNIIFLVELIANIYSCGGPLWNFWKVPWNVFDFVIVAVGVVLMTGIDLGSGNKLKLLRAFRVFRIFKRVPSLNKIIVALVLSLPGVFNAFIILLIFFCIYAILAVELFVGFGQHADAYGTYTTVDDSTGNATLVVNSAMTARGFAVGHEYYGTFMRALYTLFQVFTGESWSEAIARPLLFGLEGSSFFVSFFFVSFILITQIVLANVVVAVLLDKFVADPEPPATESPSADDLIGSLGMDSGLESASAPVPALASAVEPAPISAPPSYRSGGSNTTGEKLDTLLGELTTLSRAVADIQGEMKAMRADIGALKKAPAGAAPGGKTLTA